MASKDPDGPLRDFYMACADRLGIPRFHIELMLELGRQERQRTRCPATHEDRRCELVHGHGGLHLVVDTQLGVATAWAQPTSLDLVSFDFEVKVEEGEP